MISINFAEITGLLLCLSFFVIVFIYLLNFLVRYFIALSVLTYVHVIKEVGINDNYKKKMFWKIRIFLSFIFSKYIFTRLYSHWSNLDCEIDLTDIKPTIKLKNDSSQTAL
ncbi:hypothetical protein UFOVP136_18 [uncultured Caudovirales phage]|uniref:Uncharacterized protein n=1 Tax=uncultured Caudovirales phage TaxID=2100421 RepID=A0A6J5LG15_9CAUD|nr:hypothetical protein UFOVP136_18 [uncultured Caudovirales phage]